MAMAAALLSLKTSTCSTLRIEHNRLLIYNCAAAINALALILFRRCYDVQLRC